MSLAALFTWIVTASAGLYLLTIWLIEYDREFQSAAATRLPVPVISAHALLAVAGLVVWAGYLITDTPRLAYAAALTLVVVATLGLIMAARWIGVYRAHDAAAVRGERAGITVPASGTRIPAVRGDRARPLRGDHGRPGGRDGAA